MIHQNFQYHYTVILAGRAGMGKTSFLMLLLDRSDIKIIESTQTADYHKVVYQQAGNTVFTVYKFYNLDERPFNMDELLYSISLLTKQVDYILYFLDSVTNISDFDRWVINKFNNGESLVHNIVNVRGGAQIKVGDLIDALTLTGAKCIACDCASASEVCAIADILTSYANSENALFDISKYLETGERTVVFVEPIGLAKHLKTAPVKYHNLMKTVMDHNGISVYVKRSRLKHFFHICSVKPEAVIIDEKLVLNVVEVEDILG